MHIQNECYAKWPEDFAVLDIPIIGQQTVNTTWPYLAVMLPDEDDPTDKPIVYHTDNGNFPCDFMLVKQVDGKYFVEPRTAWLKLQFSAA
jgi:hypothetical protein